MGSRDLTIFAISCAFSATLSGTAVACFSAASIRASPEASSTAVFGLFVGLHHRVVGFGVGVDRSLQFFA